jgi:CRP/FNR family transcriptional activator FtrB
MKSISTNIAKRFKEFSSVALFQGFNLEELAPILSGAQICYTPQNKVLLWQDEEAKHICVVLSGHGRIYRIHSDGRETITRMLSVGDTMFENVVFFSDKSPVNGEVFKHSEILMIPAKAVKEFADTNAKFAVNIAKILAERTNQMMFQQELISLHSAKERLGTFFLSAMLDKKGCHGNFELEFEKSMVARHLAMTPETLSRTLKDLKDFGVKMEGNLVKLDSSCSLCEFHDSMIARKCSKAYTKECPHYQASA